MNRNHISYSTATAIAACLFLFLMGCAPSTRAIDSSEAVYLRIEQARAYLAPEALQYLEAALDTVETQHATGPDYDWKAWRLAVLTRARGADSPSDTYSALRYGLNLLPGGHARFREPASLDNQPPSPEEVAE